MLDLDILEWLLLFCRQPLFRRFLVGFLRAHRLGHLGEGEILVTGSHRSLIADMDSDVVLLGTDLPSSILAASVLSYSHLWPS